MKDQYDENRYGQPIDDVTVYHDIIDARKLRTVLSSSESAMFSPGSSRIIGLHNKKKQSDSNMMDWIYHDYDVRKGADTRLLKALFLYLYRGTDPSFFPPDDEVDEAMEGLVRMIDESPYADPYRKMCRLNRWHADVIGRLIFDEIMAEAKGMMDELSKQVGGCERSATPGNHNKDDGEGSKPSSEDGDGGSSDQDGNDNNEDKEGGSNGDGSGRKNNEPREQQDDDGCDVGDATGSSDGDTDDDGCDVGDATGSSDGDTDGDKKANVSSNQLRQNTQALVNRAIERVRSFTKDAMLDASTSIEKALEAAKKLGDGEANPLTRKDMKIDVGDISDKMGRMRSVFDAEQATRIEFAPGATVSLCYSDDIRNVVPSELALMADPDTSILFDLKYMQRRLLCRKTEGTTRGGKGPIIMCIDVSGSMDVKMMSWAMSLAGAIGYTAASQGRDVAFIYYSDTVPDVIALGYECQVTLEDLERSIESVVYNQGIGTGVPHEHSMIPRMQEAGISRRCESNGGYTQYSCAFNAVKDLFQVNPLWEKADMLFLTDGGDGNVAISKHACEELQAMGVRAFGIGLIDADHGKADSLESKMKESLGYFDSYTTVKFGRANSTEDIINQLTGAL